VPDTTIGGRYTLENLLGRGGMSEVYRAQDEELGRRVALKLLAPDADRARFEREARAVASLAHPNVMQVYDYGEDDGRPYMVLEYVPGGTLEERLADAKGPLRDDETQMIAAGIASGLAHAHARGVVHRDLKPANVLFDDDGRPKLADFGIARMAAGEGTLTEAGTVLGTAAYISPEQASGSPASPASDVYSFGVILYRMLTGRLPFESNDPMELVMMNRDVPPPPVTAHRDDPPGRLEATAMAALEKDPAERPADGAALLAALGVGSTATIAMAPSAAAAGATQVLPTAAAGATTVLPGAPPPAPPPGPPPERSRMPLLVAALLVLLLAGGALAYAMTRPSSSSDDSNTVPLQSISIPTTKSTTSTTEPTTTEPTTTEATTTTTPSTTEQTTTRQQTTAPRTTAPTTTAPPPPTTTAPPPTTTAPPATITFTQPTTTGP
jgi:serine/threonine-protein kinase